jgi:hypothetical protein
MDGSIVRGERLHICKSWEPIQRFRGPADARRLRRSMALTHHGQRRRSSIRVPAEDLAPEIKEAGVFNHKLPSLRRSSAVPATRGPGLIFEPRRRRSLPVEVPYDPHSWPSPTEFDLVFSTSELRARNFPRPSSGEAQRVLAYVLKRGEEGALVSIVARRIVRRDQLADGPQVPPRLRLGATVSAKDREAARRLPCRG